RSHLSVLVATLDWAHPVARRPVMTKGRTTADRSRSEPRRNATERQRAIGVLLDGVGPAHRAGRRIERWGLVRQELKLRTVREAPAGGGARGGPWVGVRETPPTPSRAGRAGPRGKRRAHPTGG